MSGLVRFLSAAAMLWLAAVVPASTPVAQESVLPRFTEEREAAALCFLRKNATDLLGFLEGLKKNNPTRYQREIRAVFQVAEMLADLEDDPRRHELELEIWKIEIKAHALASELPAQAPPDRTKTESELRKIARNLVDLDTQVLELKAEQAEKELTEIRNELSKARDQVPSRLKARYEDLIEQGRKRRKS
jgi:ElaB/YqjD/DUF883 family membrane-anchored ribosome-binding protein/plasmid stabilization system protein ParE